MRINDSTLYNMNPTLTFFKTKKYKVRLSTCGRKGSWESKQQWTHFVGCPEGCWQLEWEQEEISTEHTVLRKRQMFHKSNT